MPSGSVLAGPSTERISLLPGPFPHKTWQIRLQGAPLFHCQHPCMLPGSHPWQPPLPHPLSLPSVAITTVSDLQLPQSSIFSFIPVHCCDALKAESGNEPRPTTTVSHDTPNTEAGCPNDTNRWSFLLCPEMQTLNIFAGWVHHSAFPSWGPLWAHTWHCKCNRANCKTDAFSLCTYLPGNLLLDVNTD